MSFAAFSSPLLPLGRPSLTPASFMCGSASSSVASVVDVLCAVWFPIFMSPLDRATTLRRVVGLLSFCESGVWVACLFLV
eukprot:4179519-Pyramimonas_sp.AAC.1